MDEANKQRKGGRARAASMNPSERKALATKAAHERWKLAKERVLSATHEGDWELSGIKLVCAVLENGKRIFSERSLSEAFAHVRSGSEYKRRGSLPESERLPVFVSETIAQFMSPAARERLSAPIRFHHPGGGGIPAWGIEAELLPEICDAYLAAREAGALNSEASLRKAKAAERILRALAKVGVIAIIDEVTGYQFERDKDELQKLLASYVSEEFRPWANMFPTEFYKEMFRLRGLTTDDVRRKPQYFGHLTNDVVYSRLLPGMVERLGDVNPVSDSGRRSRKHHQHLKNVGVDHLRSHIAGVTMLMRATKDWRGFKEALDRAAPKRRELDSSEKDE